MKPVIFFKWQKVFEDISSNLGFEIWSPYATRAHSKLGSEKQRWSELCKEEDRRKNNQMVNGKKGTSHHAAEEGIENKIVNIHYHSLSYGRKVRE